MNHPLLLRACAGLLACALSSGVAAQVAEEDASSTDDVANAANEPGAIRFDESLMKQRGLDGALSSYFRRAVRFVPGESFVTVTLNGTTLGRRRATFDSQGQLCFDAAFVRSIGLVEQPSAVPAQPCPDYRTFSARTVVTLQPGQLTVDIVTPAEFVQTTGLQTVQAESGGTGGLINYRAFTQASRFDNQRSAFSQIEAEVGVNMDDWLVRTQQLYTSSDGDSRFRMQRAFVQKTFTAHQQVMQAGQLSVQSPLFGGLPLLGAQWFPEYAMRTAGRSGVEVRGMANGRARVEVRQSGALIHSTVVPPGPFTLGDVQTGNRNADLQVRVIEDTGAEQVFTVSAASLMLQGQEAVEGLSLAAGRLWDAGEVRSVNSTGVATAANGLRLTDAVSATVGGLIAGGYQSAGGALRWRPPRASGISIYLQSLGARDTGNSRSGAQGSAAVSVAPQPGLSLGLAGSVRTPGYVTLQEARRRNGEDWQPSGYRNQVSTSANWAMGAVGALNLGLSREDYFDGASGWRATVNWGAMIGKASLSLGLARSTLRPGATAWPGHGPSTLDSNSVYLTLNVPLGTGTRVSGYSRTSTGDTRTGASVDHFVNDQLNLRASVDRQASGGEMTTALGVNALPRHLTLSAGVGRGSTYSSHYLEASGGVLFQGGAVAFSPYAVGDTFGMARVGEESGIRLNTPAGPVWTGPAGFAALPRLSPFTEARIEVDSKSIPRNVELFDSLQVIKPGRGAVIDLTMPARRVRRVLLAVQQADGAPMAGGASVLDAEGELVGTTASRGLILLPDLREGSRLSVRQRNAVMCTLGDIVLETDRVEEYFQRGTAKCLPADPKARP